MSAAELIQVVTRLGGRVTLEAGKLKAQVPDDRPDLLEQLRENRDAVLEHLTTANTGTLERLPSELEALIRAASSDALPTSAKLEAGIVPDLNRYVLAWGCAYLTGDHEDALGRLWAVWRVWRVNLDSRLN